MMPLNREELLGGRARKWRLSAHFRFFHQGDGGEAFKCVPGLIDMMVGFAFLAR
jgi:hypothetical protein